MMPVACIERVTPWQQRRRKRIVGSSTDVPHSGIECKVFNNSDTPENRSPGCCHWIFISSHPTW